MEFILSCRSESPRIGREKLKLLMDRFYRKRGIVRVSVSTIGRIIRYLKERGLLRGEEVKKLSYYGKTGRFIEREKRRQKMCLLDLDLPLKCSRLSRSIERDFWSKFKAKASFEMQGVQTDNGSEFLGEFAKELEGEGMGM